MGARDTEEMLEACKAQGIQDEREITRLQQKLDAIRTLIAAEHVTLQDPEGAPFDVLEVWKLQQILDGTETP